MYHMGPWAKHSLSMLGHEARTGALHLAQEQQEQQQSGHYSVIAAKKLL
jgi:hypothetical protein